MKPNEKRLNVNVHEDLHEEFKALCADDGRTMSDALRAIVTTHIEEHKIAAKRTKK